MTETLWAHCSTHGWFGPAEGEGRAHRAAYKLRRVRAGSTAKPCVLSRVFVVPTDAPSITVDDRWGHTIWDGPAFPPPGVYVYIGEDKK